MDRLLRRKPVTKPKPPGFYAVQQPAPLPQTNYHENVEKSSEAAFAAAQTIRSLENRYNRNSVTSYPPKSLPQNEIKPEQNYSHQEHARKSSRSTSYSSESAISKRRTSHSTSESAGPRRASGNDTTIRSGIGSGPESSVQMHGYSPFESSRQSYSFDDVDSLDSPAQDHPYTPQDLGSPSQLPSLRTSGYSISPRQPTAPDSPRRQSYGTRLQGLEQSQPISTPKKSQDSPLLTVSPEPERDEDDLSSLCSDDSFFEQEREKYYRSKMHDAMDAQLWQEAKANAIKLSQIKTGVGSQAAEGAYILFATIYYMLEELPEASGWLAKIPRKKSTEPNLLVSAFNMEAAIAFRRSAYDDAFAISKKAAKYARRYNLASELDNAVYISKLICETKADFSEAKFYQQMLPDQIQLPDYLRVLPPTARAPSTMCTPTEIDERRDVGAKYHLPITPPPPSKTVRSASNLLGNDVFIKAGLVRARGTRESSDEYHGSNTQWKAAIKMVIEADDDTSAARYLYRTVFINHKMEDLLNSLPLHFAISRNLSHAAIAIIQEGKAKIQSSDFHTQPIQLAAQCGNARVLYALLAAGAQPDMLGASMSITALQLIAPVNGPSSIVEPLLQCGADPLYSKSPQENALQIALLDGIIHGAQYQKIQYMLSVLKASSQYRTVIAYLSELHQGHGPNLRGIDPSSRIQAIKLLTEYKTNWDSAKKIE
ncbi:hypothetical protein TWF694_006234 [Orbilia ellipsospora]|uniref:Protein 21.1 n=1 Tax=Orbilia ellipsospora TaxID=2528407 RepID=A0AAV9XJG8_9PEZI